MLYTAEITLETVDKKDNKKYETRLIGYVHGVNSKHAQKKLRDWGKEQEFDTRKVRRVHIHRLWNTTEDDKGFVVGFMIM